MYVRDLETGDLRSLRGSDNGGLPFWSPDGSSLAFFAERQLKRVARNGGVALTLAPAGEDPVGGDWNQDDLIVFAPNCSGKAEDDALMMRSLEHDDATVIAGVAMPAAVPDSGRDLVLCQVTVAPRTMQAPNYTRRQSSFAVVIQLTATRAARDDQVVTVYTKENVAMPRADGATEILTIRVSPALARRLAAEARRQRRTRSAVARTALAQGLGQPVADPLAEARRQSLLVRRRASEQDVLRFVTDAADLKGWE